MDFIGTEVGNKIRSAIKAKLTELGKTVDDELIDYIMVMVANKKDEAQMARDLQPFFDSDTVRFTAWLHKVLQKLEQVTVIVTDEEFKIATSAFNTKVGKKRKSSESGSKKKSSSSTKDEPKEKKKKVKHEHGKHGKSGESSKAAVAAVPTKASVVLQKHASKSKLALAPATAPSKAAAVAVKPVKAKKMKLKSAQETGDVAIEVVSSSTSGKAVPTKAVRGLSLDIDDLVAEVDLAVGATKEKSPTLAVTQSTVRAVAPVQRPVMMVSDDSDDDDFINLKTDLQEEVELLGDERTQKTSQSSVEAPAKPETVKVQPSVTRTVVLDSSKVALANLRTKVLAESEVAPQSAVKSSSTTTSITARRILRRASPTRKTSPLRIVKPRSAVTVPERPEPPRVSIMSRIGAVLKRKAASTSDDEDNAKNGNKVASVIKVKPRPKISAAGQPSKTLLLRAVADAHRSVSKAPVREKSPEPIVERPPLYTRKYRSQHHSDVQERLAITLPNIQDSSELEVAEVEGDDDEDFEQHQLDALLELTEPDEAYVPELKESPSALPPGVEYSPSPIIKSKLDNTVQQQSNDFVDKRSKTPEFLVTLDGYKPYNMPSQAALRSDGRMGNPSVIDEIDFENADLMTIAAIFDDDDENVNVLHEEPVVQEKAPGRQKIVFNSENKPDEYDPNKKMLKSLDRCRFWPACRQGDSCTFYHPTQPCKTFPNCSFGDRCLYIHPNCKFDASCTRKDCPFTHASPRNLTGILPPAPIVSSRPLAHRPGTSPTCRFYPNCNNTNCRYFHPIAKLCRYGRSCSKPDCSFTHSEIPSKEKMKWVSSTS